MTAVPITAPPPVIRADRRHNARRYIIRRETTAEAESERRRAERRGPDRRESPGGHLRNALSMLDDLSHMARGNERANRAIAGAAQRMWLALAEFERETQSGEMQAWIERRSGEVPTPQP